MNSLARFVYEVATTRHRYKLILSIAGTIFWYGIVGLAVYLAPHIDSWLGLEMSRAPAIQIPLGIVLLVTGIPMVVWTIARFLRTRGTPIPFNPPPIFVRDGLYRIIRNPMHLGWTLVLAGLGLLMASFTLLLLFTPVFFIAHILYLKLVEEKELENKFGQAYRDYKQQVGMFIPKLHRSPGNKISY